MKSKFIKAFFLSFLLILLLTACNGECKHRNMSEDVIPPTCGERGYTVFMCVDCSFSFESDYVAPSPHSISSSVIAPTCSAAGYTLNECQTCDYSYLSDPTSIIEHTLNVTVFEPTCTSVGYTLHKCSGCDYEMISDNLPPASHSLKETKVAPTCEKEGYTTYSCNNCTFSYVVDRISALSHTYTSTVTAPTCTDEGYTTKKCTVCSKEIVTDYTDPKGHSFNTKQIRATSSSDGYMLNSCTRCDYSYKSNYEYSYAIFTGAYVSSSTPIATGIDVSSYNGPLNWDSIASQGIDFAIIRAGSSKSGEDLYFDINYKNARSAGILLGAYYYVEATSVEEILRYAEDFEEIIKSKKFEYPIYLDFEKQELGEALGKEKITELSCAFIEKLQADGYFAALYTNNNWLENFYIKDAVTSKYDIWYARYIPADKINSPEWDLTKYGTTMGIWQYTDDAILDGFPVPFDMNLSYKDYPTIIKRYHYNGY